MDQIFYPNTLVPNFFNLFKHCKPYVKNFNHFKHIMSQKSWAASHDMWLGIHQLDDLRDRNQ